MTEPRSWGWYAARFPDDSPGGGAGSYHSIYPTRGLVKMCGYTDDDCHPIRLTEDPAGEYYAWVDARRDPDDISMVHTPKFLFEMCFPYGLQAELDAEAGTVVRLTITEREDQ